MNADSGGQGSLTLAQQVDALCDRFEGVRQRGEATNLEAFLPPDEPARGLALRELVRIDLEYQLRAGEVVRVKNYLNRYPEVADDSECLLRLAQAELRGRQPHVMPPVNSSMQTDIGSADAALNQEQKPHKPGSRASRATLRCSRRRRPASTASSSPVTCPAKPAA